MSASLDRIRRRVWNTAQQESGNIYPEEEPQGFTGGVMSGLLGTASGVASFAHADDLANSIEEYRLENYTPTQPVETDLTSLDYWLNPNGAIYDLGNMVGSSIPSLAVGVATGGLGSALGAGSMLARGATAAAQTVGRRALGATAQNAIRRFGNEGLGYLGSSLVDSTSEGGNARMQAIQQGNPNADSVAWEVALKNIPLNALSNAAEWNIARRGWLNRRGVSGEGLKKRAVNLVPRALPALGVNALQEGTQELAQQTISDSALGNPVGNFLDPSSWTDEQRQSFQAGLLGGAVLGGAPALARAARGGGQSQGNRMSIDEFMTKVGMQETGGDGYTTTNKDSGAYGKYQIMPENWQPWVEEARAAGVDVGSGDRSDPKSQEAVAKFKMEQYREAYGDEGALVAWYSGPANAERWANGETTDINGRPWDAPQGEYPSIKSYVESTLNQSASPGSGYADSFNTEDFSLDLKNEIIDFANDKANSNTDLADIDFFADKTTTNIGQDGRFGYGRKTFVPTDENIKQVIRKYPRDFFDAQLRAKNRRSINNYHNNLIEGALFARRNSRPNQQPALPYIPVDNNRVLQILKEQLQNQGEEKNKLANDIETQRKDEQLKYLTRLLQNISRDTQTRRNNNRTRNAYENITAQRQSSLSNLRGSGQATPVQLVQPRNNDYQERARDISGRLRPVDYNPVVATAVNNNGQNIFEDEMNMQGMLNGLLSQYNEQQTNERNARIASALYSGNQGGYSSDDRSNPLNWDNNMLLPFDWNESEQGSQNRRVQNTQPTDNIMQGIFDGLVPEYRRQREQQRNERLARALSEGNQGGYSSDDRSNPINWTNDMLLPLDMYGDWNANREPKYTAQKANKAPEKSANEPAKENKAAEPVEKTTKSDEKSEQKNKPATSKEEKTQKEPEYKVGDKLFDGEGTYLEDAVVQDIVTYKDGTRAYRISRYGMFVINDDGKSPEWEAEKRSLTRRLEDEKERLAEEKAEEERKAKEADIDGFADDKTPLQRGRIIKALNKKKRYQGWGFDNSVMPVKDFIKKVIAKNYDVFKHTPENGKTFYGLYEKGTEMGDHGYPSQWKTITKTEYEYAMYLKDKNKQEDDSKNANENSENTVSAISDNIKEPAPQQVQEEAERTEKTDPALAQIKDPEIRKELEEKLNQIRDKYRKMLSEVFTPQGRKKRLGIDDVIAGSSIERIDAIEEAVKKDEAKQKANIEKTSEKADNISNNANSNEVNNNGILNEEQNRRGNTANGREQSGRAGENEEKGQPTPADTEADRNEGQPARRPDTDDNAELSSDGRLSGTEQTENGSRNDSVGNDERKIEPVSSETVEKVSTQPALINYRMSDKDDVGEGGKETRYKNNIKAIKLLKQLEVEGRKATPTEQKVLARYSGWGGLTSAFSDEKTNNELKELLTNEEYAAAKSSILSAYYTAPNVVKSIWKIADKLGFKGGRILEPSMGVGNFFGLMPSKIMNNSNLTGVELDSISGQIASQLYQRANINIMGFENLQAPDNFFDLAIGNVPFGQFGVHDPKFNKYRFEIHNYFFAKALDKVRPGGIVMFITTKGTMDNAGSSRRLRTYLGGKADLIDAIRLPDTAFKGNTGTSVISDIIILKKRTDPSKADIHAKQWEDIEAKDIDGRNFYLNEYYVNHPEMIAGKLEAVSGRYGGDALNVSGKDIDLTKKLSEITKNISKDVYQPLNNPVKDSKQATMVQYAPNTLRENSYTISQSGKVCQNIGGKLEEVPNTKQGLVKDFVNLKRKLRQLMAAQVDNKISDSALDTIRKDLNTTYDTFVKNNGYINNKTNSRTLATDPEYGIVSAIERYSEDKKTKKVTAEKADIFKKRTVGLIEKPTKAESPSDALAISLREQGKVDIDYMANLIGKDEKTVVEGLKGVIYKNPMTGLYETQDEYLSGNVREKLAQAKQMAKADASYDENVKALEKVQPADLVPEEVTVNLGASWIPASDIEDFAKHLLDVRGDYVEVQYLPANGEWVVKADDYARKGVAFTETWGVDSRWSFDKLLEAALNQRSPKIMKSIGENEKVVDNEKTTAVNNMIDRIKKEFKDWIWTDDNRTKRLLDYYNTNFNNWKLREYDGSHLTLPGYSLTAPKLRKHQKDAIWRIMQNSNTLLAHSVGAGKTWTMQTAAMEMRRVGICRKPLFVIPGHMMQQFANEFRQIYPNAQLLMVSAENLPEVTAKDKGIKKAQKLAQRQRLLSQIATEDWDGIIISHDMFKRIPMSPEATNEFYQEQVNMLEQAIREMRAKEDKSSVDNMAMRNLEKSKTTLTNKLKRDVAEEKKDMVIPFEELGIDQIFVDEADLFKNLAFTTKMNRVAGLSNTGSQRSMDMYLKTRYITKANGGRGVVFATGTPISNTLAEMYTMMRYLDENNLRNHNLLYFDNWANQFVNITQTVERNPDGNGYRAVNKASAFVNRPEMVKMFRKFADVKRPEDLNLKVPKMKTGKRIVVSVEPSNALKKFITNDVKKRAEKIRNRQVDPTEDNMLKLTGELRKASLDVRLINPDVSASQAGTKIAALTDNVYQEYKDSTTTKGAQLIFCDLSTPAGASDKKADIDLDTDNEADISNGNFNVYQEIKRQLIAKGIKQNEIAFIHDAKTREKKQELFDAVNNGEVRVLIGSTEKMGAGTNCQKKLVALHHLDCPWRPRDIEQREGRILRQGNENPEVGVYTYVTKDSFDANMWEKIKNKQHFITEALSADTTQRTIEDNDVLAMSFAEAEAIASGNPLMAEKVLTDAEVNKYMALKNSFDKKQARIRREVEQLPGKITNAREIAKKAGMDAKAHKNISGDKFVIKIGNKTFTDRKKAQLALNKITEPIEKEQNTANVKIGEVAGFDLKARFMRTSTTLFGNKTKTSGEIILTLVNNWSYEAKNSVRSIEATANNVPQKVAETNEEFVRQATERQKALNKELRKNFADEDKLNELLKKQADIDRQLNLQYAPDNQEDIAETVIDNDDNEYEVNPETGEVMNYQPQQKEETVEESKPATNGNSGNDFLREHVVVAGVSQKDMDSVGNTMAKAISKDDSSPTAIDIDKFDIKEYQHMYHKEADKKTPKTYYAVTNYAGNTFTEVTRNLARKNNAYIDGTTYNFPTKQDRENFLSDIRAFNANPDEHAILYPNAPAGFMYDNYRHTQTKDILKRVRVTDRADKERFNELKSLAKQSGGYYSKYASGFLFNNEADRNKFFDAVRGLNSDDAQYSLNDNLKKELNEYEDIRETAVMLDDSELTDREREFSKIGEMLGTPIYWFKADPGLRGWHSGGITYLNKDGNWPHEKVFWHETFHWIANNNPKLFDDMLNHIMTKSPITQKQLDDYAKKIYRGDKLPKRQLAEEMMADAMYDVVQRTKFLRNIGKENPSLAKRFLIAVRDLLNRFMDFLHNPKGKLTTAQRNAMRDYFHKTALSIKDGNGNNIFERGSNGEIVVNDNRSFATMSKEEEDMMKELYGDNYMDELFDDDDDYSARFSADNEKSVDSVVGTFKAAFKNIGNNAEAERDERIKIQNRSAKNEKARQGMGEIGFFSSYLSSPSRIAEKVPAFRPYWNMARNAMDLLLKTRNYYNSELNRAYENLKTKEDKEALRELLMRGELNATEYGKGITDEAKRIAQIVKETGVKSDVAKSYIIIRELFKEAYNKLNRIRKQVQRKSENVSASKLKELQDNDFIDVLSFDKRGDDEYLVTYDEQPYWEKEYVVDEKTMKLIRDDDNIQVLEEKDITEGFDRRRKGEYNGEKIKFGKDGKVYQLKVREGISDLSNKEGYIPHFFHDFFVVVEGKDGKREVVDSGRTQNEAVKKAEAYLKENPKTNKIIISPKRFNFSDVGINEEAFASMVGDEKYREINERIAKEYDMTLDEAKKILDAENDKQIQGTGKHRFLGNLLHRKGSKGYEQKDLDWILAHYFNSVARYEALETQFKPHAISLFEQMYGRFSNGGYTGTANYIKNYINDVNGNPSALEQDINRALNNNPIWRKYVVSRYGDRAALQLAGSVTNTVSVLKLGVFNVSSALLNFTQLLNSWALLSRRSPGTALNDLMKACYQLKNKKGLETLTADERKAIEESGVLDELGLDSGAGYHKMIVGKLAEKSMMFFKGSEAIVRRGTVLAAYRQAIKEGKSHVDAVKYAAKVNRKANFDYGVHDAPNIFRRGSIISQMLLQFQKYPIKQFELMREMLGKGTTKAQKAVFWGGYLLLAGAFGLPAEDLLWETIGLIPSLFGIDLKDSVRQFGLEMAKDANPLTRFAIRTMMYGIASNINIDISSRFGMADIIPWTGTDYNKDAGFFTKLLTTAGGVTGSTIAQTFNNLANGEGLLGAARAISPTLGNIYWAAFAERTDARGRITNKYDDVWSKLLRAMGFRSLEESLALDVQSLKYSEMERTSNEKQKAVDAYLDAEADGEPLGEYARRLRELGVKRSTVKKARDARKKDRMQRSIDKDVPDYAKGAMNLW